MNGRILSSLSLAISLLAFGLMTSCAVYRFETQNWVLATIDVALAGYWLICANQNAGSL